MTFILFIGDTLKVHTVESGYMQPAYMQLSYICNFSLAPKKSLSIVFPTDICNFPIYATFFLVPEQLHITGFYCISSSLSHSYCMTIEKSNCSIREKRP